MSSCAWAWPAVSSTCLDHVLCDTMIAVAASAANPTTPMASTMATPRRIAYGLNENQEIELWLWPGLDTAPAARPARYPVLRGVTKLEFQYLNADLAWVDAWPTSPGDAAMPRAVRLRIVLASGAEIVRVFALNS